MKNIVLIGMPGCGKSTVGVILAKTLGAEFIDTDLVIQRREGALLQQLIISRGLSAFLDAEEAAVRSVRCTGAVIATGGSVVYREGAMEHLGRGGVFVYLSLSY
ncbi:MAG TPA: shikimate kinase, partial [Candidatus Merdivicinus faecavium]|nr:shikimate kinase [Candidatus Merdivicinus faecavium]